MLDWLAAAGPQLLRPLSTSHGIAVSLASGTGLVLILVASFMRTMVPLRSITVASNLCLVTSAALGPNPVAIALYCILIPLNIYRLVEILKITRKVEAAGRAGDLSGVWLKPYMKARSLRPGEVLFRKGDAADELYLLLEGELDLVEIGKKQPAGELFGEISFFSPEHVRTLTARCATDCVVLSIAEPVFRQLYFQSPKLAFQVSSLIASRLGADVQRLRGQLAAAGLERG